MVKILLGLEEVAPDIPDDEGRTPLSHAAENGHEEVVKILLKRKEVNHDTQIVTAEYSSRMQLGLGVRGW